MVVQILTKRCPNITTSYYEGLKVAAHYARLLFVLQDLRYTCIRKYVWHLAPLAVEPNGKGCCEEGERHMRGSNFNFCGVCVSSKNMCKLFTKRCVCANPYVRMPQGLHEGRLQKFFLHHRMWMIIGFIATPLTTGGVQASVLDRFG